MTIEAYVPVDRDNEQHVVVVVGEEGRGRRYCNVLGPYDNKKLALNAAQRVRYRAKIHGVKQRYKLSIHVRPFFKDEDGEDRDL